MERIVFFLCRQQRRASLVLVFCLMAAFFPSQSHAYFNRGTVSLSLGESSLSLTAGSVSSVSVTIDPIKQDQLPGCGMAECPQTCGDGCLNENGECMCAGTEYKTYYSEVSVASSDDSVATASYSNGTLTVRGNAPGSASITVTGKLRQYTDATVTLPVTVSEAASAKASQPSRNSAPAVNSTPSAPSRSYSAPQQNSTVTVPDPVNVGGSSVTVENVGTPESIPAPSPVPEAEEASPNAESGTAAEGNPSGDANPSGEIQEPPVAENSGEEVAPEGDVRDTAKGRYRFVVLTPSTDIPACFADAANEGSHLVFQKKSGENIDYSWTFDGAELDPNADYSKIRLGISESSRVPESLTDQLKGRNVCNLDFNYSGKLPGTAEIYVNVTKFFPEDQKLFLYRVSQSNGKLTSVSDQVEMSNGYASFSLEHCSSYLLTDSKIKSAEREDKEDSLLSADHHLGLPLLLLLVLVSAAAVLWLVQYFLRRKK